MTGGLVQSEEVLWDGPLFADEVGWPSGITETLREQYELESRRVIPAKEAMEGVVSIYFRPVHREWALVRYARRYRWIFEILLRQGFAGERRLLDNGFTPEDVEFLMAIVPDTAEQISPAVYEILWRSAPYPVYITIVAAISNRSKFTPAKIIKQTSDIDGSDEFVFERLIRSHLIERAGSGGAPTSPRERTENTISVELEERYQPTSEGMDALPIIVSEHQRIFERAEFEPLQINPNSDPDSHLPDDLDRDPSTTSHEFNEESGEKGSGIIDQIASEFDDINDGSNESGTGRPD